MYYVLKKYHIIIIKEDGQQGIYNSGKRLNAVWLVVQGGAKRKSLGAWWILIKEHNIIGNRVKITISRLCRGLSYELYSHSCLLLQRVNNPKPTFTSCRRLNPFYWENAGVNLVIIFFPVNKKLQLV